MRTKGLSQLYRKEEWAFSIRIRGQVKSSRHQLQSLSIHQSPVDRAALLRRPRIARSRLSLEVDRPIHSDRASNKWVAQLRDLQLRTQVGILTSPNKSHPSDPSAKSTEAMKQQPQNSCTSLTRKTTNFYLQLSLNKSDQRAESQTSLTTLLIF